MVRLLKLLCLGTLFLQPGVAGVEPEDCVRILHELPAGPVADLASQLSKAGSRFKPVYLSGPPAPGPALLVETLPALDGSININPMLEPTAYSYLLAALNEGPLLLKAKAGWDESGVAISPRTALSKALTSIDGRALKGGAGPIVVTDASTFPLVIHERTHQKDLALEGPVEMHLRSLIADFLFPLEHEGILSDRDVKDFVTSIVEMRANMAALKALTEYPSTSIKLYYPPWVIREIKSQYLKAKDSPSNPKVKELKPVFDLMTEYEANMDVHGNSIVEYSKFRAQQALILESELRHEQKTLSGLRKKIEAADSSKVQEIDRQLEILIPKS